MKYWNVIAAFCGLLALPTSSLAQGVNFGLHVPLSDQERAAILENGTVEQQFDVGVAYDADRRAIPQKYIIAAQFCRAAAERGYAPAQTNLGDLYEQGQGVPQDDFQAFAWFRKAAEQGVPLAQSDLGAMYGHGRGVPLNYEQARLWYLRAADQNLAVAQFNLGALYLNGQGVPKDYAQAAAWFEKSAAQG